MICSPVNLMFRVNLCLSSTCRVLLVGATLAASQIAYAQTPAPPPNLTYDQALVQAAAAEQQFSNGYASVGYSPAILTIPGRPFTAHRVYKEWPRNGTAGNQPSVTTTVTIARDSSGRIHYENSRDPGQVTVMISDPVQHLNYRYDVVATGTPNATADSCVQPQISQISGPAPTPDPTTSSSQTTNTASSATDAVSDPPPPPATKKDLGLQQMEGTTAFGQQRNDYLSLQPGIKTMRTLSWFSMDLGLNILEASDYSGQNMFSINTQEIDPSEPDPALFAVPQGYTLPGSAPSCIPLTTSN